MPELTPRQEKAVHALLAAKTMDEAAQVAGCDPKTLWRWRKEPEFRAALDAARRELFSAAADKLRLGAGEAVAALRRVLADPETAPAVVVQSAAVILSHCFRAVELADISERLDALEEAQANAKSHN